MAALIAYHSNFAINTDDLTDDQFFKIWGQLKYSLKKLGKMK